MKTFAYKSPLIRLLHETIYNGILHCSTSIRKSLGKNYCHMHYSSDLFSFNLCFMTLQRKTFKHIVHLEWNILCTFSSIFHLFIQWRNVSKRARVVHHSCIWHSHGNIHGFLIHICSLGLDRCLQEWIKTWLRRRWRRIWWWRTRSNQ